MNSPNKALAIVAVAFLIGLGGCVATKWAPVAAAAAIVGIALAPNKKDD